MSLENLGAQFQAHHSQVVKLADHFAALQARLDAFESKANRPEADEIGGTRRDEGKNSPGYKAFEAYCRRGIERVPANLQNALTVGSDVGGGYLAPGQFETELDRVQTQFSPIRQVSRVGTTNSGEVQLPRRTSPLTGYWVGEVEARTASAPSYGMASVPLGTIACYCDVSAINLDDSAFDLGQELAQDFGEAFAAVEGTAFVNGDGTKGRPQGILQASGITTVASGAATSVTADQLIAMAFSLPATIRARATWALNSSTLSTVIRLKSGDGMYLFQPGLQGGQINRLLGIPLIECPDLPDLSAGSKSIILGDWAKYRVFDKPNGTQILRDPFSQAANGIVRFHARKRTGATLMQAESFRVMVTGI